MDRAEWEVGVPGMQLAARERRMREHGQERREMRRQESCDSLDDPYEVGLRAPRRVRPEQLVEVRHLRRHRSQEQILFGAEPLKQNRLRDPRGFGDIARGRGVAVLSKEVARDAEQVFVGDRLRASHA